MVDALTDPSLFLAYKILKNFLIAFENTIRLSVHILIASAHALIVLENRISFSVHTLILSAHTLIASTLPSNTACSPTVPGGDTPCLTAGDARRANPWTDNITTLRRRRHRTAPTAVRASFLSPPFQCGGVLHAKDDKRFFLCYSLVRIGLHKMKKSPRMLSVDAPGGFL